MLSNKNNKIGTKKRNSRTNHLTFQKPRENKKWRRRWNWGTSESDSSSILGGWRRGYEGISTEKALMGLLTLVVRLMLFSLFLKNEYLGGGLAVHPCCNKTSLSLHCFFHINMATSQFIEINNTWAAKTERERETEKGDLGDGEAVSEVVM
jgi:hypothetical protein